METLEARNVSYEYRNSYQTVKAVNDVSTEFCPGKVYAIVGSSGSGKKSGEGRDCGRSDGCRL